MNRLLIISLSILSFIACSHKPEETEQTNTLLLPKVIPTYQIDSNRLQLKAKEALVYNEKHQLNTNYCILIDMQVHSGRDRIFLWDFKQNKIILSGLCSHGCGDEPWGLDETKNSPIFSNMPDSHLSSLGKYKIGKRGWSNWGIHVNYKLYGLEESNNNAYKRVIVLHSWEAIEEKEIYPGGSSEGWGCPAINNKKMKQLDSFLKKEKTPVLLWIFE